MRIVTPLAVVTSKGTYAETWLPATMTTPKRTVRMHTLIMGARGVDHRDGDGLNNTRANLRFATNQQNARNRRVDGKNNTTGYKGVIRRTDRPGKFRARIVINGRARYLGDFNDPVRAARARCPRALRRVRPLELPGRFPNSVIAWSILDSAAERA